MINSRVTRLGEISPFGRFFMAKFFLEKNRPNQTENTIKQFYIVNQTKTWLGDFLGDFSLSLGDFSLSLGDFFTKTSGHPDQLTLFLNLSIISRTIKRRL
jgi:hypothetical protein